ncbi:MAG: 3-deoxy-7-phosphoheptulonate synthase [Planctomycetota bacterium]
MYRNTDDLRIENIKPLIPPAILMEELPISEAASDAIFAAREIISRCLAGADDRLVVVTGPCSIHDVDGAMDYANLLQQQAGRFADDLVLVMRVYFEKPRTTVGWKGLINDPGLDGSYAINKGLHAARGLLCRLGDMGLPAGCEFLDTITPQFIADLVSWGAIGARTTESQIHRELASGLSMCVGFKNATSGDIQVCIDAMHAARQPHHFLSVTKQGLSAIVATRGNDSVHPILRGGAESPNHQPEDIAATVALLREQGLPPHLMVDCSHANSGRDPARQPAVAGILAEQIAAGDRAIAGVMIESHIVGGRQSIDAGTPLLPGKSVTDPCLGWDETVPMLETLARAVRARRAHSA